MNDIQFMQRAIDLAKKGWPMVAPNPMVGCVIVHQEKVVATGYHQQYGQAHAEVNAIQALEKSIPPNECVLYVTLEPCSHQGKTPPCVDLILSKGFKKVVIACKDPNPLVSGNGIKKLQDAGIEVAVGILEKEARQLNKRFITFFEKKRPYIFLKWAQTANGFISKTPVPANRESNRITGEEAQKKVHQLRAQVSAIMVGKNTVLADNPHLTTRLVAGKNPIRLMIDKNLEVPKQFNIYNNEAETIVFNQVKDAEENNILFVKLNFDQDLLAAVLVKMYELNIQTVLVEGGAKLLQSFLNKDLWDEALVYVNPQLTFEQGLNAPELVLPQQYEMIGQDKLYKLLKG